MTKRVLDQIQPLAVAMRWDAGLRLLESASSSRVIDTTYIARGECFQTIEEAKMESLWWSLCGDKSIWTGWMKASPLRYLPKPLSLCIKSSQA